MIGEQGAAMITRRVLLAGAGASLLAAPAILRSQQLLSAYPFRLGIASGDPSPDGFVIWTRLCPDPLDEHGGMPFGPVDVDWFVYEDEGMKRLIQKGSATAWPELGHAVHVELSGLQSDRPYWYRFILGRDKTPLGRARTLPAVGSRLDSLRFGVAGCQNYEDGLYTAYAHLAQEDVAFIWHYGDYIYEEHSRPVNADRDGAYKPTVREHIGPDCLTIGDYRRRYAQYKMDPNLQAAHRAAPWFTTYDDHEIANNWTALTSPYQPDPALFAIRRDAAMQAYYEHMPLRRASMPTGGAMQLYRRASFGDLLDVHFLDTRQYRTKQPCKDDIIAVCAEMADPKRTVLGDAQEAWLSKGLRDRDQAWKLVAQQVMVMPLDRHGADEPGETRNMDSWAGYDVARERLLGQFQGLGNVVVMTGDEHRNYVGELRRRAGHGDPVAVEIVTSSISSGGDAWVKPEVTAAYLANNDYLKHVSDRRGYALCEVGRDSWTTRLRGVERVTTPGAPITTVKTATIERGRPAVSLS